MMHPSMLDSGNLQGSLICYSAEMKLLILIC